MIEPTTKSLLSSAIWLNTTIHKGGMSADTTAGFIHNLNDVVAELDRRGVDITDKLNADGDNIIDERKQRTNPYDMIYEVAQ